MPVLYCTKTRQIVNNESKDIILMFNSAFNAFCANPSLNLAPDNKLSLMEEIDSWTYEGINNGVYKCGFA